MDEEVAIEIEALQYTVGDSLQVLTEQPLTVAIDIHPYTADDVQKQFVQAKLVISLNPGYPAEVPQIQLQDVKGLTDARLAQLQRTLESEAASLAGEMMLGHLCEVAKETLTSMNQPDGACIFCMECLVASADEEAKLTRLPCYHCFHFRCFARWWRWEQQHLAAKRARMQQEFGAAAQFRLPKAGLVPDADGIFTIACPSCRLEVLPQDLAHVQHRLAACDAHDMHAEEDHSVRLAAEEMNRLRLMQRQQAAIFERQRQRGGIVSERYAVVLEQAPSASDASAPERAAEGAVPSGSSNQAHGSRAQQQGVYARSSSYSGNCSNGPQCTAGPAHQQGHATQDSTNRETGARGGQQQDGSTRNPNKQALRESRRSHNAALQRRGNRAGPHSVHDDAHPSHELRHAPAQHSQMHAASPGRGKLHQPPGRRQTKKGRSRSEPVARPEDQKAAT